MTENPTVTDLLEQIQGYGAWAVIRRKAAPTAGLIGGTPHEVASLLDIRSRRASRSPAAAPTASSRCRSARCASAASPPSTTARP